MADDFSRPLVILADICEDVLELLDIERVLVSRTSAAPALFRIAPNGWLSSWAIELDIALTVSELVHLRKLEKSPRVPLSRDAPKLPKQR